jgi:hypothetical protein
MNRDFLKKLRPPETPGQGSIVMTLSLFIMLLSFFMILNSQSRFVPERVLPAMKSLNETFSTRIFNDGAGRDGRPDLAQMPEENKDAYQSLDQYFRSSFPNSTQRLVPSRGLLFLEVDAAEFERKMFGRSEAAQKTLLEKMWAYPDMQMEIWLNLQDDPGISSPETQKNKQDSITRLSTWATALEKSGLDKEHLTIGIQKGDPSKVLVLFHAYKPYSPE